MSIKPKRNKVVELVPPTSEFCSIINRLAEDSSNVSWGPHTQDRMVGRGITTLDVLRVMRTGSIEGDITAGRSAGEWKCKMVARIKGSREVGVVTVVANRRRIFVKTTEWEDLR